MRMKWSEFSICVRKVLGKERFTKLQSDVKFFLTFRHDYSAARGRPSVKRRTYIFIIDGKTVHGGLSDRLRGLFGVYAYCRQSEYDFKIFWEYPDTLTNYLIPQGTDWLIKKEQMCYDRRYVDFKFFNNHTGLANDETSYFSLLKSSKPIVHVYSCITLHEDYYSVYFQELFQPSEVLSGSIAEQTKIIGDKYVSITFRFIGLFGDFIDRPDLFPALEKEEEKAEYIDICLNAVKYVKEINPWASKVLVTADSMLFLDEAKKLDFVYVIPGDVSHMDTTRNLNDFSQLKSFLDLLLISKAEKSYNFAYKRMYSNSKFASTASLIGGRRVIDLTEKNMEAWRRKFV